MVNMANWLYLVGHNGQQSYTDLFAVDFLFRKGSVASMYHLVGRSLIGIPYETKEHDD